jgi:hypothetical protein
MKSIVNRFLSTTFFAFTFYFVTTPLASVLNPQLPGPVIKETGASVIWTIEEGETITGIADAYYGDPMYWTTVWNDNPWMESPWNVEKGWAIELRNHIPNEPQALDAELLEKLSKSDHVTSLEVRQHPALVKQLNLPVDEVQAVAAIAVQTENKNIPEVKYVGGPLTEAQITYLGQCEAGMDPAKNTGNGYYGAFQFSYGTWKSMNTGYERADMAPLDVQKDAVQRLVARSSIFGQFPGCSKKMRSLGLI